MQLIYDWIQISIAIGGPLSQIETNRATPQTSYKCLAVSCRCVIHKTCTLYIVMDTCYRWSLQKVVLTARVVPTPSDLNHITVGSVRSVASPVDHTHSSTAVLPRNAVTAGLTARREIWGSATKSLDNQAMGRVQ